MGEKWLCWVRMFCSSCAWKILTTFHPTTHLYCVENCLYHNITMNEFGVMVVDCLGQAQNQLFQAGFGLADKFRQIDLAKVGGHHHFEHRHHHLDVVAIVQVHLRKSKGIT